MQTIEGVIAKSRFVDGLATLTVFPIVPLPIRHVDPARAIDLTLAQEAWQTDEGHRAHVDHLVGQCAEIDYTADGAPRIAVMRHKR